MKRILFAVFILFSLASTAQVQYGGIADQSIVGQATQTATINNIIPATASSSATATSGYRSFSCQVVSTGTAGTFIFEGSNDNTNFVAIPVFNQLILTGTPITSAITATSSSIIYQGAINYDYIRLRIATTITGGSIRAYTRLQQTPFTPSTMLVSQATAANLNITPASTPLMTGAVASAAAADATANPTGAAFRMFPFNYNSSTWDRPYNNYNTTTGDAGAKTATFNGATQTNFNARGAFINIQMGAVTGTSPLLNVIPQYSPDGGTTWINISGGISGINTGSTNYGFIIYPANISTAGGTPANITTGWTSFQALNMPLPRTWRLAYQISGTTPSFTITAVNVSYMN